VSALFIFKYALQLGKQRWNILRDRCPDYIQIYRIVDMNQFVTHTDDISPWNSGVRSSRFRRDIVRRFAYDLQCSGQRQTQGYIFVEGIP